MTSVIPLQVFKANSTARRLCIRLVLGTMAFGWVTILGSHHYANRIAEQDVTLSITTLHAVSNILLGIAGLMCIGLLTFSVWIGRVAVRSLKHGCYPPPNSLVFCDTLLVKGWRATIKAVSGLMLATAAFLSALGICLEIVAFNNL